MAVDGVDIKGGESWYDSMLNLRELGEKAIVNLQTLSVLQIVIYKKAHTYDWKFSYAAVGILLKIVYRGVSEEIRLQALEGLKEIHQNGQIHMIGGLRQLIKYKKLSRFIDTSGITHLQMPELVNPNIRIRQLCIEQLILIVRESTDAKIRSVATEILLQRAIKEDEKDLKASLQKFALTQPNFFPLLISENKRTTSLFLFSCSLWKKTKKNTMREPRSLNLSEDTRELYNRFDISSAQTPPLTSNTLLTTSANSSSSDE